MKRLWIWVLLGLLVAAVPAGWWWRLWRLEHSQDVPIFAAAQRYGVDPALVKAVVWKESLFQPRVRGRAGEIGLMQLMDPAAQEWAEAEHCYPLPELHLYDPRTNTLAGTWYLAKLLQRYRRADRPIPYALADYNAGRANVLRWAPGPAATNSARFLANITFPTTKNYLLSIQRRRERYQDEFPPLGRPLVHGDARQE